MYPYATFLGVDGQLHRVRTEATLLYDENGLPWGWKVCPLPSVKLIARVPDSNPMKIEEHPLRRAWFKMLAARTHSILEKQRPQDVTFGEARQMAWNALEAEGFSTEEIVSILERYW